MPKSKRNRIVTLSKTIKKPRRENNQKLLTNVRDLVDNYDYVFVFSVENMRNSFLKDVRAHWTDSRLLFGKTKVMAKALGMTASEEARDGLSRLSKYLHGNVGLFLTSHEPAEVLEYFSTFTATDYPRAGAISPLSFTIPAGTIYADGAADGDKRGIEPLAHSMETAIRSLGVPSRLVRGKVTIDQDYVVCTEGEVLDSRKTRLLKMFGKDVAEFRVKMISYWSASTTEVTEVKDEDEMEE